jgi:hypothetical protein
MADNADHRVSFSGHAHAFARGLARLSGKRLHGDRQAFKAQDCIADFFTVFTEINCC